MRARVSPVVAISGLPSHTLEWRDQPIHDVIVGDPYRWVPRSEPRFREAGFRAPQEKCSTLVGATTGVKKVGGALPCGGGVIAEQVGNAVRVAVASELVEVRHQVRPASKRLDARGELYEYRLGAERRDSSGPLRHVEAPPVQKLGRRGQVVGLVGVPPEAEFAEVNRNSHRRWTSKWGPVNPKIASEMLGHSTVGMTLDLYSHVSETMQCEAADTIDLLLFESAD